VEDDGRVEVRSKAILTATGMGAVALVVRLFPPDRYPIYPACPVRALTGWRCPGCGSTHAVAALLAGHWSEAWQSNPAALMAAPLLAAVVLVQLFAALRWNRWQRIPLPPLATKAILTAVLLFGLLRNIAA
jgi:hypothetical protein